jgi:hypothetical protein
LREARRPVNFFGEEGQSFFGGNSMKYVLASVVLAGSITFSLPAIAAPLAPDSAWQVKAIPSEQLIQVATNEDNLVGRLLRFIHEESEETVEEVMEIAQPEEGEKEELRCQLAEIFLGRDLCDD